MKNKDIRNRALKKTILAALLLVSVNPAHALMNLTVSYDTLSGDTTFAANGEWDSFVFLSGTTGDSGAPVFTSGTEYLAWALGGYHRSNADSIAHTAGDLMPVLFVNVFGVDVGSNWGFDSASLYAPVGYVAGAPISYSYTTAGDVWDLQTDLVSGVYSSPGMTPANQVNFSSAVVPESSAFGILLGGAMALLTMVRRRR